MAREFGKLYMKMWARGSDFTRLTASAQRLYMFLISQPDLNRTGVVIVAQTRWLKGAADLTAEGLESDRVLVSFGISIAAVPALFPMPCIANPGRPESTPCCRGFARSRRRGFCP